MRHDPGPRRIRQGTFAVAVVAGLAVCALADAALAGPKVTLTYHGEIEGLPATASIEYEDLRIGVSPQGFALHQGRPAWARQSPSDGRIYLGGQVDTATSHYVFTAEVSGTSDFGYAEVLLVNGSERFLAELDFASDGAAVYMDGFALTPNPLDPPQPTYVFTLDVPPPPDDPALVAALNASLPDPAVAPTRPAAKAAASLRKLRNTAVAAAAKVSATQGKKRRQHAARERTALKGLLKAARKADAKSRLGVPLQPLEAAVNALLAAIPV